VICTDEFEVVDRYFAGADESSFENLFRTFSPQLVGFFRRRGCDSATSEDLAQEVMLTVYRCGAQIRDRELFRPWLFKVARNAICRAHAKLTREAPTVELSGWAELLADTRHESDLLEFEDWMSLLGPDEREVMTLRFVEEWEYHEIAAARAIPIGTVQWRVFNSKKKLAAHLNRQQDPARQAA
jgi:RNA polymerase sigma-70 factor (ECF subfamily)